MAPGSSIGPLDSYGTVFVYSWEYRHESGDQQAQLEPGDLAGGGGGGFGDAVAISPDGSTIVVGAPGDVGGGTNAGAVYVFQLVSGSWVQVAKVKASDTAAGAAFGASVSISGFEHRLQAVRRRDRQRRSLRIHQHQRQHLDRSRKY